MQFNKVTVNRSLACIFSFAIFFLISGCANYDINENYKDFAAKPKIKIAVLGCYISGNDRQSMTLQTAGSAFLSQFSKELAESGHFSISNESATPSFSANGVKLTTFSDKKSAIFQSLHKDLQLDYAIYAVSEVASAGNKDKFCLNFVNLKNVTEDTFCNNSQYLISSTGQAYTLNHSAFHTVTSQIRNQAMKEMKPKFKELQL